MPIESVSSEVLGEIARHVFGTESRLEAAIEIRPQSENGVLGVCGCTGNISYIVALAGHLRKYVFRINRGYRDAFFEREVENYRLIEERTSIPVPRVYSIDRSRRITPTPYMVMDYMVGEWGSYLSHSDNASTRAAEKEQIQRTLGRAYAEMHNITRTAETPDAGRRSLLGRLSQLESVVRDGQLAVEVRTIDLAREAIESSAWPLAREESLCLGDAELHCVRADTAWQVSFVCDVEWVGFRDPYGDLVGEICSPRPIWALDSPLGGEESRALAERAFFIGYETLRKVDYERLRDSALYQQLEVLCSVTDQVYRPERADWVRGRAPLYAQLLDLVAARATHQGPPLPSLGPTRAGSTSPRGPGRASASPSPT
jgi:aminoglycoside phosphotransferase (APT) family kinase protein